MDAYAVAAPSLALTKYWGKLPGGTNLPATPSVAVTLSELRSATAIRLRPATEGDSVTINGVPQRPEEFALLLDALRQKTGYEGAFEGLSVNNFPTAAGLASSASGMAALARACDAALGARLPEDELSAVARLGSGSASRSIFGGFVLLPAGADRAIPLLPQEHWPELRIIAIALHSGQKPISSRKAMNRTAESSPYYAAWVENASELTNRAVEAVKARDLTALGERMRESYLRMFATMLSASPPVIYWRPESVALIHYLQELRAEGVPVWETMDAGPQVKVLLEEVSVEPFLRRLRDHFPDAEARLSAVGAGARAVEPGELTEEERRALRGDS
ncbi:MAG: diphosphomevalonate decarboxylase [Alkalispirochaetaceae bacterium]